MASDLFDSHHLAETTNSNDIAHNASKRLANDANAWTIAIDLKLNLNTKTPDGHLGAERKSALLKELRDESKGKPVSLFVQVSHPEADGKDSSQAASQPSESVSRYEIHDGVITPLPSPKAIDPSGLTADLVRTAGSTEPSRNLGLIIFSHGFGKHGIGGDAGKQSLDSLSSSISGALSSLHKDKLDLLAFDSCSMAQVDTLERMAPVTRDLVAAPEYMTCRDDKSCGINLNSWLTELMKNPQMTGVELGNAAVTDVQREYRQLGAGVASPAVSNFSLDANYDRFNNALNDFSVSLTSALNTANNKTTLRSLTEKAPEYERFYFLDPPYPPTKDLLSFAREVHEEVQQGVLFDPTNKLRDSSQALIEAQNQMTQRYFGAHQNTAFDVTTPEGIAALTVRAHVPYDQLGGLSIAMPDSEQIAQAQKDSVNYKQLVASESLPQLEKWREFLLSVHD